LPRNAASHHGRRRVTGLGAVHEIALADDAQQLAARPTTDSTDAGTQQNFGYVLHACIGTDGNDIRNHYVCGFHGSAPSRVESSVRRLRATSLT
jgi:hypothetical protein